MSQVRALPRAADRTAQRQIMTMATGHLDGAALTSTSLAPAFNQTPAFVVPGTLMRRAAAAVGDLLGAVAIVLCFPFVILAIGLPIVLSVRLLLWIGGLL